jgi:dihydrolipoamide dehydrogenase
MVVGEARIETEVLVIGGGPGGYAAAFQAAHRGLDVVLVSDEPRLGGVCLLRGCIPSKTLLSVSDLIQQTRRAVERGVHFDEPTIELEELRGWKDHVVERLTDGLEHLAERRRVRVVRGRAVFAGSHEVRLENSEEADRVRFDHAIVSVGSRPIPLPGTEFGGRIMDSSRALELDEIPGNLLVVGGGYVGLELGMVYATLGTAVTVAELTDGLLPGTDRDLVKPLRRRVDELFEEVLLETEVAGLEQIDDGVRVEVSGDERTFERVLVAIGRRPNTDELGLDETEVRTDDDGFVTVDEQRRTADEAIFAIGDVAGGMQLAHEAMHEGRVAADVIAGEPAAFDRRAVPAVVYTDPEVAWCGLTERDAASEGIEVEVARYPWSASGRAASIGATDGMTKLLLEPKTERVMGVGIVGPDAEALIAEGALAVEMGAVARDLAMTVHPHPTLSETLGEAAEAFFGSATHLARRTRSNDRE